MGDRSVPMPTQDIQDKNAEIYTRNLNEMWTRDFSVRAVQDRTRPKHVIRRIFNDAE